MLGGLIIRSVQCWASTQNAGYNVSNRPDRDVYTTGLVQSNTRRKNQAYGVGLDYTLTELSAMAVVV